MKANVSQLDGVDLQLGGIIHKTNNIAGDVSVICRIYPTDDLQISSPVDFEVSMARDDNPTTVTIQSPEAHEFVTHNSYFENGQCFLRVSWMKNRTAVPVWFQTVRRMLRKVDLEPWYPSTLVAREFREFPDPSNTTSRGAQSSGVVLYFGSGNHCGRRPYNEDVKVLAENLFIDSNRSISLFGVLDGHGGRECAAFVDEELAASVVQLLSSGYSVMDALFQSFREVDQQFFSRFRDSTAGSTANIAVYDKSTARLYIANTGDARAVLSRDGFAFDLSYDRKASDPEEIARIVKAGGFVVNNRVMASLAVSRAFGDNSIKAPNGEVLVVDPEITYLDLSATGLTVNNEFLILATDGLWDVLSSQMAVDFVRQRLISMRLIGPDVSHTMSIAREEIQRLLCVVGDELVRKAIFDHSSMDNVTAVIVLVRNPLARIEVNSVTRPSATSKTCEQNDLPVTQSNQQYSHGDYSATRLQKAGWETVPQSKDVLQEWAQHPQQHEQRAMMESKATTKLLYGALTSKETDQLSVFRPLTGGGKLGSGGRERTTDYTGIYDDRGRKYSDEDEVYGAVDMRSGKIVGVDGGRGQAHILGGCDVWSDPASLISKGPPSYDDSLLPLHRDDQDVGVRAAACGSGGGGGTEKKDSYTVKVDIMANDDDDDFFEFIKDNKNFDNAGR